MGLKISGLNELRERLERLRPEEVMARALVSATYAACRSMNRDASTCARSAVTPCALWIVAAYPWSTWA